ncbi:MAG: glycoside hydrolase [Myxococcota bacterium]
MTRIIGQALLGLFTVACSHSSPPPDLPCSDGASPGETTLHTGAFLTLGNFHVVRRERRARAEGIDIILDIHPGSSEPPTEPVSIAYWSLQGEWTTQTKKFDGSQPARFQFNSRLATDEELLISIQAPGTSFEQATCQALAIGAVVDDGDSIHIGLDESPPVVEQWLSTGDGASLLAAQPSRPWLEGYSGIANVIIDPTDRSQVVEGFGAAMTETSASLIAQSADSDRIMRLLFGRDEEGIGLSFVRVPLGASDFALDWYTYDDDGTEQGSAFSLEREEEVLFPQLRRARQLNPELKLMGTPWSPPGWMKIDASDPRGLVGGRLNPERREDFAEYLSKTVQGFREAGVPLDYLSLQNEPLYDGAPYPCSFMSAAEQAQLVELLVPRFADRGLQTKILLYDHNWTNPTVDVETYIQETYDGLSAAGQALVAGTAWHGYGDIELDVQSRVQQRYPDDGIYFTEITGGGWDTNFGSVLTWNYENIFIGSMRHDSRTALLWNLVLDPEGGPNLRPPESPREALRGVVTVDPTTGEMRLEHEFFVLGHSSRFVRPGATRIGSNHYGDLRTIAYENPDGSLVTIILNRNRVQPRDVLLASEGAVTGVELAPRSLTTLTWNPQGH